jgi:hypothetical protein
MEIQVFLLAMTATTGAVWAPLIWIRLGDILAELKKRP